MEVTERMLKAGQVAFLAHEGQTYNSGAYIEHPKRVYLRMFDLGVEDEDYYIVAWLHDVVEDTKVTLDEIRAEFGDRVAEAVDAISRRKKVVDGKIVWKEQEIDYLDRVSKNEIASLVKHADMIDNLLMTRSVGVSPAKAKLWTKYVNAIATLFNTTVVYVK